MSAFSNTVFSTTVQFHEGSMHVSYEDLGIPDGAQFGIITQTITQVPMDPTPTVLVITIDNSGSMEHGDGKKCKLDLVIHTVKNILRTIVDKNMPICVEINTFSDTCVTVVELTDVSPTNLSEVLEKMDKLYTLNSTNIEHALKHSQKSFPNYTKKHHLFLTDGEPTIGSIDKNVLISLVDENFPATFIGYGIDHNAELLIGFSKKNTESSYQLVNDFEMIGNLCGEILFQICYPAVKNITVSAPSEGDLIYNAKTNEWMHIVRVATFTSGKQYHYPVYTLDECAMIINTIGESMDKTELETDVFINPTDIRIDLTKEMFRHAADHLLNMPEVDKPKVREMFRKVRTYARENGLLEDTYYKLIFDDLYTCYMGNHMDIQARVISNSRNQTFRSASARRPIRRPMCGLQRSISCAYNDLEMEDVMMDETLIYNELDTVEEMEEVDEDDITQFMPDNTQNILSATQDMYEIMRAVSST